MSKNWNIQQNLRSIDDVTNYLDAALAEKDYEFLKIAVKDAVKALKDMKCKICR